MEYGGLFRHDRATRRFGAASTFGMSLIAAALAFGPDSAGARDWAEAPAACFPDRAERWDAQQERPLCHCPPQEFCPPKLDIRAGDIKIAVNANGRRYTAEATQLLGLGRNVGLAETLTALRAHAAKFNQHIRHHYALTYEGGSRTQFYTFTPIFDEDVVNDWVDEFRMSEVLVNQCCDAICPEGTQLKKERVRVPLVSKDLSDLSVEELYDALNPNICEEDAEPEGEEEGDEQVADATQTEEECVDPEEIEEQRMVERTRYSCEPLDVTARRTESWPREGCLAAGTMITLASGEHVAIETLRVGDLVMTNTGPAPVKAMSRFSQELDAMYGLNGGEAFFTVEHPILTPDGWKSLDPNITSSKSGVRIIGALEVGDVVLMADGEELVVSSIERMEVGSDIAAYNLSVGGDGTIIANDMIMKGFHQMQMHY